MGNIKYNCLCIDLTIFDTEHQLKDFIINALSDKICHNSIWQAKKGIGRFSKVGPILKLWVDAETYSPMAYKTEKEYNFYPQFAEYLVDMPSMKYIKSTASDLEEVIDFSEDLDIQELSIDTILDKINKSGIKSLNKKELDYLKEFK